MTLKLNHKHLSSIVEHFGWDGLIEHLDNVHPNLGIYSVSQDWIEDSKYICKAKGSFGDLVIIFK